MPSSYTSSLRLVLPVTGELASTWGDTVNAGLTELVEDAIAGSASVVVAGSNVTLTTANAGVDQARNMFLNLTGTPGAPRDIVVPAQSKLYFVHNATNAVMTVKTPSGAGIALPAGLKAALYCNGTDVVVADGTLFGAQLKNAAGAAAARTAIGADVYKTLPNAGANLVTGEVYVATAGFTLNTGLTADNIYSGYNNSGSSITITQGSGLTLRFDGTTLTGNRSVLPRGRFSIWVFSSTEYIISGSIT